MIQPWCERQREALRVFRQAITVRAGRESEVADGGHARQQATEQRYQVEKARVQGDLAGARAGAITRAELARQQLQQRSQRDTDKLQREHRKDKQKLLQNYLDAKLKLEAEFREARCGDGRFARGRRQSAPPWTRAAPGLPVRFLLRTPNQNPQLAR